MVASSSLRELDRQLAAIVRPALEPSGFMAGDLRSFRRIRAGEHGTLAHIVQFQIGIRALAGKFTVNLVVYHSAFCPEPGNVPAESATSADTHLRLTARIGLLAPEPPGILNALFRRGPREPGDRWWSQSDRPAVMSKTLRQVVTLIETHAPRWFEENGSEARCRQEHEIVLARRNRAP